MDLLHFEIERGLRYRFTDASYHPMNALAPA